MPGPRECAGQEAGAPRWQAGHPRWEEQPVGTGGRRPQRTLRRPLLTSPSFQAPQASGPALGERASRHEWGERRGGPQGLPSPCSSHPLLLNLLSGALGLGGPPAGWATPAPPCAVGPREGQPESHCAHTSPAAPRWWPARLSELRLPLSSPHLSILLPGLSRCPLGASVPCPSGLHALPLPLCLGGCPLGPLTPWPPPKATSVLVTPLVFWPHCPPCSLLAVPPASRHTPSCTLPPVRPA